MPTFTWTGAAADNSWSNPANWVDELNNNAVPGELDIAIVDVDVNITTNVDIRVTQLNLLAGSLNCIGNTNWSGNFDVAENASIQLNGETYNFGAGTNFTGLGLVEVVSGELNIEDEISIKSKFKSNANGKVKVKNKLKLEGDSEINGQCELDENASLELIGENHILAAGSDFTGNGTLDVISGNVNVDSDISIKSKFKSSANSQLKVKTKLKLEGDSEISSQCELDENASLELIGENHILAAGSDFIGNGTLDVISGNVNVDSDISIKSKFKSSANSQVKVKTKLKLEGDSEISSQCELDENASLELIGENHILAAGSDFIGNGTLDVISGNVNVDSDISIKSKFKSSANSQVKVKTKLKLENDSEISGKCDLSDNASLELIGLNHIFANGSEFTGNGIVDLLSGELNIDGEVSIKSQFKNKSKVKVTNKLKLEGNSEITGSFDLAEGAAVEFAGGTHNLDGGTAFTGTGLVKVTGGILNVSETINVEKFELTGGTVVGQDKIIANIFVENFGLTLGEGKDKAISNEFLEVTDVNATPDQIVYTLTTLPAEGTLLLNGAALGVNATFTQSDINNGLLTYQDGDSDATGDSFGFTATANGQEITSSTFAFTVGSVAEFRDTGTAGIFAFTETSTSATLEFTVATNSIPSLNNEIGVFNVDDDQGTIDGIAPGEDGYLQAAFNRAKVINSVLANNPNGFKAGGRLLGFESTDRLGFYQVQDGTTDTVLAELAGGGTPDNVFFSTSGSLQVANYSSTGFTLQWADNVAINVESIVEDSTPGTGTQGGPQGELIDLRDFTGQVSANFTVNREADFDNIAGFYVVQNEQGAILDELTGQLVNPGDEGYAQIAIRQRLELELSVENQGTVNISTQLDAGLLLAPFIMVDGGADDFQSSQFSLSRSSTTTYFAFSGANAGGADHITLLGDNQWGFEDLPNGGDRDYNDLTITLNLAVV